MTQRAIPDSGKDAGFRERFDRAPATNDGSARRAGAIIRAERERRGLTQCGLAARAGVSATTLSALERGQRTTSLDLADRVLAAMGLRLHLAAEAQWGDIDAAIAAAAGQSPAQVAGRWDSDLTAYLTAFDGIPLIIDGLAAAALQGAPVPVDALSIAVPAGDADALDRLTTALGSIYARRGDGFESRDPRVTGSSRYGSMHGPLEIRLADPFEPVLWLDIDALPPPRYPVIDMHRRREIAPLTRARVAVTPITSIEASDAHAARVLQRTRQRLGQAPMSG